MRQLIRRKLEEIRRTNEVARIYESRLPKDEQRQRRRSNQAAAVWLAGITLMAIFQEEIRSLNWWQTLLFMLALVPPGLWVMWMSVPHDSDWDP